MADHYTPAGSNRDIQVLSPSQVIDVERVAGYTVPSGVYFERVVPLTIWGTDAGTEYVDELAAVIEQELAGGFAKAASFVQDVDATGLVFDAIEFFVSIENAGPNHGTFSTTVTVPVNLLTAGLGGSGTAYQAMFDIAYKQLVQTAGA